MPCDETRDPFKRPVKFIRRDKRNSLDETSPIPAARIDETQDGALTLALSGDRTSPAEIWVVQYEPGVQTRPIESGRNAGLSMTHFNMVRAVEKLADWSGGEASFILPDTAHGLDAVVLVQDGPGGRVLSAARLP